MFPTIARWFPSARCLKPSLSKKIASLEENQVAVNTVRAVLRKHGPVTINDCWSYAKEEGMKSKRQMKIMLRWLREQQDVAVKCRHLSTADGAGSSKEFLFFLNTPECVEASGA